MAGLNLTDNQLIAVRGFLSKADVKAAQLSTEDWAEIAEANNMKGDAVRMLKHHFANAIKAITGEGVPGSTTKRKGGASGDDDAESPTAKKSKTPTKHKAKGGAGRGKGQKTAPAVKDEDGADADVGASVDDA